MSKDNTLVELGTLKDSAREHRHNTMGADEADKLNILIDIIAEAKRNSGFKVQICEISQRDIALQQATSESRG